MMLSFALAALAYTGPVGRPMASRSAVSMAGKNAVPPLPLNPVIDGLTGSSGFDPLMLATSQNLKWMQEAELKHGRVTMLAVIGWIAVDLGVKFPGEKFAGLTSLQAHDAMVKSGDMFHLFLFVAAIETLAFGPTIEMALGNNNKEGGDLGFDPLSFKGGKDYESLKLKEIKNGRLAMLAFSGLCTQAALTGKGFPYF